jgi:ribosome maturation factor RimP
MLLDCREEEWAFPLFCFYRVKEMSNAALEDKIREIIEPAINALGIELDNIELNKMRGKALLRIYIDREEGITIDDCTLVSREVETLLDVEDPIPYSYVLEVSSPGLDRPLRNIRDFVRFSGRNVRVITKEPIDKQTFFVGQLAEADDNEIVLLLPKDKTITIDHKNISKARLEVEF